MSTSVLQVVLSNTVYKNSSALANPLTKFVHWSKDKIGSSIASGDKAIWVLHHGENILQVNQTAIEGTYIILMMSPVIRHLINST